jgi:fused signal recognition particle receptor
VSTLHLLMLLFSQYSHGLGLVALLAQVPLAALAFGIEASQRKKRPRSRPEPFVGRRPEAERPIARPSERPAQVAASEPTVAPLPPVTPPPAEVAAPAGEVIEEPAQQRPPVAPPPALEHAPTAETIPQEEVRPEPAVAPLETVAEAVPPISVEAARRRPVPIRLGLRKTRENFLARIRAAITGSARLDEIYEGLEEALIGADVGVETSTKLVEAVRSRLKNDGRADLVRETLKDEIARTLNAAQQPPSDASPLVILMAGVNGVGKTTTVAKLAALLKAERGDVVVAASDTFRAAAIEQLQIWCDRVGVDLIKQKQGSDPAAVAFDAVKAANARKAQAVLIDTAGRLQTKVNLMEELKKIARVVGREIPGAPHENWLVLDATTGQNALSQAKIFSEAVKLTGVILAKLDSTAKGGVIIAIADRLKLPVRYVGLGEELEDLRPFDAQEFVEALFSDVESGGESASRTYAA